jgi:N-acetylglucosaminyldiphosphoundecaprenol N-acetyl-beta-D-mannosaminyltransferase
LQILAPTRLKTMQRSTCVIGGFPVSTGDLAFHVQDLLGRVVSGQGGWLLTLNTEMLARSARDPQYTELVGKADIITADGMPLVWASRLKRPRAVVAGRTTGVDLVDALLRATDVPRFAVIGGTSPSATIACYGPSARAACAFVYDGKVDLSDAQLLFFCEELAHQDVRIVFLALGVPKQDQLALELRQRMPHLVLLGIGGTFEILGPEGGRAPIWMQRTGLEWFYRLTREPRRLWRRYLLNYPRGIWFLLKDILVAPR